MGAVNTVLVHADGGLEGRNTDGYGFLANLALQAPAWRAAAGPALVLGAGGAARAVAVALLEAGVPVLRLANRTSARAEALAQELGRRAEAGSRRVPWPVPAAALADAALCVNATSLGMKGQPALALDLEPLPPGAVVADLVYVPLDTPLLQTARRLGHRDGGWLGDAHPSGGAGLRALGRLPARAGRGDARPPAGRLDRPLSAGPPLASAGGRAAVRRLNS